MSEWLWYWFALTFFLPAGFLRMLKDFTKFGEVHFSKETVSYILKVVHQSQGLMSPFWLLLPEQS